MGIRSGGDSGRTSRLRHPIGLVSQDGSGQLASSQDFGGEAVESPVLSSGRRSTAGKGDETGLTR